MAGFSEYEHYDGLGLAALMRKGEVSREEVVEAAADRLDRLDPVLNATAFRRDAEDLTRRAADTGAGPFAGVPFLVKDLYCFEKGAPCGNGSRLFDGYVADFDSELVVRQRRAGLVPLGRSTTSELGLNVSTETAACGATRNPWNLERTTGGSSGGSAAAVAAGIVPLAHASDGGGSIRIPAAACGLFGLKTTRARIPAREGWAGLSVQHALTRSVRDCAALMDATAGPIANAPYWAPPPQRPFLEEVGADPGRLHIAWTIKTHAVVSVHPECRRAVEEAARLAAELGHDVEEAAPDLDYDAVLRAMLTIVYANTASALGMPHPRRGDAIGSGDVESITWQMAERGRRYSAVDYVQAVETVGEVRERLAGFFGGFDVLLTPTLAQPPIPLGVLDTLTLELEEFIAKVLAFAPFTQMFNMSGQPAASIPLHWTEDGLPVGVQAAARLGDEATLIRLSAQFEAARPWFDRRPPLATA
jgi:Asp-tRNA(Asn)/Glu-tRNA(Gln) amidotransferase A subunit family amidase